MARPVSFKKEQVLSQSAMCFWQRGYNATSMKHLEVATGLTPGSLYNSFGSKDGLFLESLDYYVETVIGERIRRYLQPAEAEFVDQPLLAIEEFIRTGFESGAEGLHLGCLVVNSSVELGPHDQAVRVKITAASKKVMSALEHALNRAQSLQLLDQSIDARQRAQTLGLLFNGMLVQWRTEKNNRWLAHAMGSVRELLQ